MVQELQCEDAIECMIRDEQFLDEGMFRKNQHMFEEEKGPSQCVQDKIRSKEENEHPLNHAQAYAISHGRD